MRPISLTALRNILFEIVDQIIQTGNPVELERKGHRLKIVIDEQKSKLVRKSRQSKKSNLSDSQSIVLLNGKQIPCPLR